jgi:hypothetical protein
MVVDDLMSEEFLQFAQEHLPMSFAISRHLKGIPINAIEWVK